VLRILVVAYVLALILGPLYMVFEQALDQGLDTVWTAVTTDAAIHALQLTLLALVVSVVVNTVFGIACALLLVRRRPRGAALINAIIDLPFAVSPIVVGLALLLTFGVNVAFTQASVIMALLFVTFPFVVRAVQPVLLELDREMEEASASLGARPRTTFRRIILPNLMPAILTGTGLAFAKAIGEFGSVVLISGNVPFDTEVASVYIFGLIESDDAAGAAAVSTVLLAISVIVLALIDVLRRRSVR
jgi:sulfate transport system permease protein